jgi:20S proteasome subunit alpha 4
MALVRRMLCRFKTKMSLLSLAFLCLLSSLSISLVDSAHSRRRPVVSARSSRDDKYDRAITTFDSSGRLLQVDYGRTAANRGASILAFIHDHSDLAADESMTVNQEVSSDKFTTRPIPNSKESIYFIVSSPSSFKVHRLDHHVFLVTTGLAGDARFLASHLRNHCQSMRQAFGCAPTLHQVALQASRVQHYLTRTAGARPLGVSAMILGFDFREDDESPAASAARIFRTDPGGVLEDCQYFAAGQHQDVLLRMLPDIIDSNKLDNGATTRIQVVSALVLAMAKATETKDSGLDVWVLDRNTSSRGNLQATCFCNVKANQIDTLKAKLSES